MTTASKHGAVTQPPLYGCAGCYEQCTWPASDLREHDAECWCALCWDEYKEAETGIEYADLPAFEPYMPAPDAAELQAELERELKRRFDGNEQASREYRADVKALVEALETACVYLPIGSRALELASIALAAHRKGGDHV